MIDDCVMIGSGDRRIERELANFMFSAKIPLWSPILLRVHCIHDQAFFVIVVPFVREDRHLFTVELTGGQTKRVVL